LITQVKNAPFKNNVMREAQEVFYDKYFLTKLDTDPNLIAFNNGVYDLENNVFRPGLPDDYISNAMPIDYTVYDESDSIVGEVHSFLSKLFPDTSLLAYFKDIIADAFVGRNTKKIVVFWTGDGDNGKSVTQKLIELMFGKLAIKMNTNIITGKKPNAGSAFAEMARSGGGVRWVVMEEPDSNEEINCGIFKLLSGNDSYFARDLFEKGKDAREIKPMYHLQFICNKLPNIPGADKAVWNRARVLPFESVFCDDPPATLEEQILKKRFPKDNKVYDKLPSYAPAFAWILLEHRKSRKKERIEPYKVSTATQQYQRRNDVYKQFIEDTFKQTNNPSDIISLLEVYVQFKSWIKDSMPGTNIPVKNEVFEQFCKRWGTIKEGEKKQWSGWAFATMDDRIEAGRAVKIEEKKSILDE
jgi:P4 family phage/plasmid primase-like protien